MGIDHPDLLKARLTNQQLIEWCAYFRIRPYGQHVNQMMLAQIAAMIAATGGAKVTPDELMPAIQSEPGEVHPESFVAALPGGAEFLASLANGDHKKP